MAKNIKICLLGAAFETNNMGVGALAAGTINSILKTYPNAHIILLDYGKQSITYDYPVNGVTHPIRLINIRFNKKIYTANNIAMLLFMAALVKTLPFRIVREKIFQDYTSLKHVSESDLLVSIAGGDSFSDIYGLQNFLYVTLPQILVLLMGKKLVLMPQTLGPYKSWLAKSIAVFVLNRADKVYSRDYESMREVKALPGLKSGMEHLTFCYDVGFIVDPVKPAHVDIAGLQPREMNHSNLVGFNISGLLYMGGYTRDNMFGFKVDYGVLVHKIIDYLIEEKQAVMMLVPHVFGSEKHAESDSSACEKIYNDLKGKYGENLALVQGTYDQSEIKYIIGMSDFFIGSRMHACIAAVSQNIPAVSIAYSRKFKGLMDTVEMGDYVADPREMDESEILSLIGKAYDERQAIREKLKQKMPGVKERVLHLFGEIAEEMVTQEKSEANLR